MSEDKAQDALDEYDEITRQLLRGLLARCTEGQRSMFNRMYKSVDEIDPGKIRWAYMQCKKAVEKNEEVT